MAHSATRRIAYNTAVQIAGKVIITIIAAVSVAILTRYLGPAGYGKFTIVLTFLSFFSIAADLGLFTVVVRRISQDESSTERVVGNALSLRGALSIVVLLTAIGIGWLLPYEPDIKFGIAIVSVALVFGLLNSSLLTVLQARLRMDYAVISDIIGRGLSLLAVIYVAWQGLGFYAVVGTAVVGAVASFIVTALFVRRFVPIKPLGDTALWKDLFRESLPLGVVIALTFIYFRLDTILLSLMRSNAEVGLYGSAFKVIEIMLTIPGFFVNSVFPVLSKYLSAGDGRVRDLVNQSVGVLLMFGLPTAAGIALLADPIIGLVAGSEFAGAGLALTLLAPALAFFFLDNFLGYLLVAKQKIQSLLALTSVVLVINVVLNVLTIPQFGYVAAALNTVLSEILVFVIAIFIVRKHYGFYPSFRILPRLLVATGLMGGVVWLMKPAGLLPAVAAGAMVYGVGVYAFNGPAKAAWQLIRGKV